MSVSINSPQNRNNVVMSNLKGYDSLYKIDLNFDADVTSMDNQVLSDYIVRVLGNHPYYIDVSHVVDLIVNENENTITVVVSNKEVQERIVALTNNNTVSVNSINESIAPKVNNKSLKILNASINSRKYILETTNNKGKPRLYEYELTGFDHAKDLYYEDSIDLNGDKTRHFLRNENGNPFFYDEYMNSQIEYNQDNKIGFLDQRVSSLEKRIDMPFDPKNINQFKKMVERIPAGNKTEPTKPTLNYSNINASNNLIPTTQTMTNIVNINPVTSSVSNVPQRNLPILNSNPTSEASNNNVPTSEASNNNVPTSEASLDLLNELNISEDELDKQLNNILSEINNNKASKNYNNVILVIIVVLVLLLLIVVFNLIYKKNTLSLKNNRNNRKN